jgi:hypothetical protein
MKATSEAIVLECSIRRNRETGALEGIGIAGEIPVNAWVLTATFPIIDPNSDRDGLLQ